MRKMRSTVGGPRKGKTLGALGGGALKEGMDQGFFEDLKGGARFCGTGWVGSLRTQPGEC